MRHGLHLPKCPTIYVTGLTHYNEPASCHVVAIYFSSPLVQDGCFKS